MTRRTGSLVAAILFIATLPAAAQWLNLPTKGIPRTKDGKPDLSAPTPRKSDGKPDLSGLWLGDPQNGKYMRNLAADFKPGEFPIQPWAEAIARERSEARGEYPPAHCLPTSIPILDGQRSYPVKIVQEPELVVVLHEYQGIFRQIFRERPEAAHRAGAEAQPKHDVEGVHSIASDSLSAG